MTGHAQQAMLAAALAVLPATALAQDQGAHHDHAAHDRAQHNDRAAHDHRGHDHHSSDHSTHDHGAHDHGKPAPDSTPAPPAGQDDHSGHTHGQGASPPHPQPDALDHAAMGHDAPPNQAEPGSHSVSPGPQTETPPPPTAGSGPPRAADAIWGADAMRESREQLRRTHGDFAVFWFQADRLEVQAQQGSEGYLWDLQGYYGGPTQRFWFKSEGHGSFGNSVEDAELQALFAQAVAPFWDLQLGLRQDVAGAGTTHAVIGIQGHAPYMFEVDAALFVSHRGDITARIEAELDQRITQRLIIQPRAEITLSAQDVPQSGIGAGLDKAEIGIRLRYEVIREFAPYIGIEQSWRAGRSADFARAAGEDASTARIVAGVRFWF